MAARKPKGIVSPWLGASKNITVAGKTSVNSTGSSEAQIDTGGGERDIVNETLMLGIAGAAGVTAAAIGARRSGLPARVMNKIRGQEVYLHGSPTTGIKEIRPMGNATGSRLAFFENPKDRSFGDLGSLSSRYAQEKGSVYVVKGPKNSFKQDTEVRAMVISKQPQKVVSEIKLANIGSNIDAITPAIKKALRKAGYNAPKKY